MRSDVGILKEIDRLGRIVIPKEFRERYGFTKTVEIIATEQGIILRNPEYKPVRVREKKTNFLFLLNAEYPSLDFLLSLC